MPNDQIGFFEESDGKLSMARLCAFLCIVSGVAVVGAMGFAMTLFAARGKPVPDGMTEFGGMTVGALVATFGGAWASLSQRTKTAEELPQPVTLEGATVIQNQPVVQP